MATRTDPEVLLHIDGMFTPDASAVALPCFSELAQGIASTQVEIGPAVSTHLRPNRLSMAQAAYQTSEWVSSDSSPNIIMTGSVASVIVNRAEERVVGVVTQHLEPLGKAIFEQLLMAEEGVEPIVLGAVASEHTQEQILNILSFAVGRATEQDSSGENDGEDAVRIEDVINDSWRGVSISRTVGSVSLQLTLVEIPGNYFAAGVQFGNSLQDYAA